MAVVSENREVGVYERVSNHVAREFLARVRPHVHFDLGLIAKKVEFRDEWASDDSWLGIYTKFVFKDPQSPGQHIVVEVSDEEPSDYDPRRVHSGSVVMYVNHDREEGAKRINFKVDEDPYADGVSPLEFSEGAWKRD